MSIVKEKGLGKAKQNPCWKNYEMVGTKTKAGKTVPNCVPKSKSRKSQGLGKRSK
jgi:hypothetical protein